MTRGEVLRYDRLRTPALAKGDPWPEGRADRTRAFRRRRSHGHATQGARRSVAAGGRAANRQAAIDLKRQDRRFTPHPPTPPPSIVEALAPRPGLQRLRVEFYYRPSVLSIVRRTRWPSIYKQGGTGSTSSLASACDARCQLRNSRTVAVLHAPGDHRANPSTTMMTIHQGARPRKRGIVRGVMRLEGMGFLTWSPS
jgi:hypothetical protein